MDFELSEEQRAFRDAARAFAAGEMAPHAARWDEDKHFPRDVIAAAGALGFCGLYCPEELGGLGLARLDAGLILEELATGCTSTAAFISIHNMATWMACTWGGDAVRKDFCGALISGEKLASYCLTEPNAGSDAAHISTSAEQHGDEWVINGQKMWITNSLQADWICLLVNTSDGPAHKNKSLVMVPLREGGKPVKGFEVGKKIRKIGMHSSDTGLLYFDEVRVPQRYRIGEEGMGFTYQMQQFQEERLWCAASVLEALNNCIEWTIEWARERQLFGAHLIDQQWVQFKLAELKTEVEALRALTYQACEHYVAGEDVTEWATMAKLKAGRLNRTVPDTCLQFWGGMGFTLENKVSRMYRDGRLASIGGGADEVMLGILAKTMGMAKKPR